MAKFKVYYTLTQVTEHSIEIEAETEAEALQTVEDYAFEHDEFEEVASVEWTISGPTMTWGM